MYYGVELNIKSYRMTWFLVVIIVAMQLGCSGGETGAQQNIGWVNISSPTIEDEYIMAEFNSHIELGGEAFSSNQVSTVRDCHCIFIDPYACLLLGFVPGVFQCEDKTLSQSAGITIVNTTIEEGGLDYNSHGSVYMHGENWSGSVPLIYGENIISVTAKDTINHGVDSIVVHNTKDLMPPPTVSVKINSIQQNSITLSWIPVYDNHLTTKYFLYRDDILLQEIDAPKYEYGSLYDPIIAQDIKPDLSLMHCYNVIAEDFSGNQSKFHAIRPCASVLDKYTPLINTLDIGLSRASFLLDNGGNSHTVYSVWSASNPKPLLYSTNISGEWKTEVIDVNLEGYSLTPTIMIGTNGYLSALYCKNGLVYFAGNKSGAWVVNNLGSRCNSPAFASRTYGLSHILDVSIYNYSETNQLQYYTLDEQGTRSSKYYRNDLGTCSKNSAITIDSANEAHIVFSDNSKILYKRSSSTYPDVIQWPLDYNPWEAGPGDCSYSPRVSIVTDKYNIPHVAYTSLSGSYYYVYYATYVNGTWQKEPVFSSSSHSAIDLVLDNEGLPYVLNLSLVRPILARRNNGIWEYYEVSTLNQNSNMAIGSDGKLHFIEQVDDELQYHIYELNSSPN